MTSTRTPGAKEEEQARSWERASEEAASLVNALEEELTLNIDIDDKNLVFAVDEAMVAQLVADAKADCRDNLLEPLQAFVNVRACARQHKRFMRVMGLVARGKSLLQSLILILGGWGTVLAILVANEEMPLGFDLFFATAFGGLIAVIIRISKSYGDAFVKTYVVERADFTDPGQATAVCTVHLPRLGFYYRPEVWRGNDGHNGIADKDAFIVLQTGYDLVTWDEEIEAIEDLEDLPWDEEEWCTVERTRRIPDFRTALDYFDLKGDTFTVSGNSMKMRRAWCRQLQRNGELYAKFEKGGMAWLDGKWGWLYALGAIGISVIFFAFGLE